MLDLAQVASSELCGGFCSGSRLMGTGSGALWKEYRVWNQHEFEFLALFLISYVLLGKLFNFTEAQFFCKLGLIVPHFWGGCKDYYAMMSVNC